MRMKSNNLPFFGEELFPLWHHTSIYIHHFILLNIETVSSPLGWDSLAAPLNNIILIIKSQFCFFSIITKVIYCPPPTSFNHPLQLFYCDLCGSFQRLGCITNVG